jgi:hypothetical protein
MVSPAKIIHRRSPYPGLSGIDSRQAGYGCLGLRQRHDVEPVRAGAFGPGRPSVAPCRVNIVCEVIEGAGPNGVPGWPSAGRKG